MYLQLLQNTPIHFHCQFCYKNKFIISEIYIIGKRFRIPSAKKKKKEKII